MQNFNLTSILSCLLRTFLFPPREKWSLQLLYLIFIIFFTLLFPFLPLVDKSLVTTSVTDITYVNIVSLLCRTYLTTLLMSRCLPPPCLPDSGVANCFWWQYYNHACKQTYKSRLTEPNFEQDVFSRILMDFDTKKGIDRRGRFHQHWISSFCTKIFETFFGTKCLATMCQNKGPDRHFYAKDTTLNK